MKGDHSRMSRRQNSATITLCAALAGALACAPTRDPAPGPRTPSPSSDANTLPSEEAPAASASPHGGNPTQATTSTGQAAGENESNSISGTAAPQSSEEHPDATQRLGEDASDASAVDEAKLDAFVEAYLRVSDIKVRYGAALQNVATAEQAAQLQTQAGAEMAQAIEEQDGISIQEFQEIQTDMVEDPAFHSRVTTLVEEAAASRKEAE